MKRYGYRGTGTLNLHLPSAVAVRVIVEATHIADDDQLYLASNLNGWNPRSDLYRLQREADGTFSLDVKATLGTWCEFKVTRGGWNRVEVHANGASVSNHRIQAGSDEVLVIHVKDWQDRHPLTPKAHTTVGDVRSIGPFRIPALDREREVQIYLPPGYERNPGRRYPVMYMFDGQNLFDESTAFAGEWQMDETCERLITRGELPEMIVVGIFNGEERRIREQTPWPTHVDPGPAEGEQFLDWIVEDIKSRIDRGFRTLPDASHTGIGGSSLGGLTSLYAGLTRPQVFGRVLAMSSAFWIGGRKIHDVIRKADRRRRPRVYLDCGRFEGSRCSQALFLRQSRDVADTLRMHGFRDGADLCWVEDPRGHHSEADWARRLPAALQFLWGNPMAIARTS